jgi:hypothetical protein
MNDTRSFTVTAHGNDADALEADAYRQARVFFGENLKLQLRPDYTAFLNTSPMGVKDKFGASVVIEIASSPKRSWLARITGGITKPDSN